MNDVLRPDNEDLSFSLAQLVDPECTRFEAAWKAAAGDSRPRLEDFLGTVMGLERAALLRELILLEAYYRRRRGEYPNADEYRDRFPELEEKWLADALSPPSGSLSALSIAAKEQPEPRPEGEDEGVPLSGTHADRGIPSRLGEYRILRQVGEGGMGVVYEAVQESLGRHVALKVLALNPLAGPVLLERFRREARAAAKLHHTNIVPVFGVGEHEGSHYYAMQFIHGQGLDLVLQQVKRLRRTRQAMEDGHSASIAASVAQGLLTGKFALGPTNDEDIAGAPTQARPEAVRHAFVAPGGRRLPGRGPRDHESMPPRQIGGSDSGLGGQPETRYFRSVARLGVQVAEALDYAHQQGIVHRDIKPSNLLLDTAGTVWVTDFGLAKADDTDDLTSPGDVVGTLRYMAPERFQGQADARSDVYALGMTLYELLTLQPALNDTNRARLIERIQRENPPAPRKLDPRIPRDLETIVLKASAKEPGQRYRTAADLAEDLRRFLADRPIRARRTPFLERSWRWCRRNPVVASLTAFVLGVVTLGFVLVTWQWQAAITARRDTAQNLYYHTIALAERELFLENWGPAEDLLDQCEPARRGWEWHYLKRLRQKPPVVLPFAFGEHRSIAEGYELAFHPGSRLLAIPNADETIRIYDLAIGQEALTLRGHTGAVLSVAFSPDGRRLASTGEDQTVRIWDIATGQELRNLKGHKDQVIGVAFSPGQGRLVASTSNDRTVKLWNANTGELLFDLVGQSTPNPPMQLAFSHDGRRLASGSADNTVKVWDVTTGRELYTLCGHTQPIFNVIFSPDGRRLVSSGRDRMFNVWDLPSAEPGAPAGAVKALTPWFTLAHRARAAWAMAVSPDGQHLAVGGPYSDGSVSVYDLTTRQMLFKLMGDIRIISVVFSPDGTRLAAAGHDKKVRLWDARTGHEILTFRDHADYVGRLLFSPDGRRLVSASADGTVRVRDASPFDEDADPRIMTLRRHSGDVHSVAFSPNGRRLVSGSADHFVKIWNAQTGEEIRVLRGHQDAVMSVAFSPDGGRVLSGSNDETAILWDSVTGEKLRRLEEFGGSVFSVAFSPDGKTFAAGTVDNVHFWDARTGRQLSSAQDAGVRQPGRVTFTRDGKLVATVDANSTLRVWDVATGKQVYAFEGRSAKLNTPSFSPDGRFLASGDPDGLVKIWDVTTGREHRTLSGHTDSIYATAFSPDGRYLATASWREVIVWDAYRFEQIQTLSRLAGRIWSVAFSPDGRRLAAAGGYKGKGEIKIWDARLWEQSP